MSDLITTTEYLRIDTVPLATPAWRLKNLSELWDPADLDGQDVPIPGAHGAIPGTRWKVPTQVMLEVHVFGDRDREGNPTAGGRAGLFANSMALRSALGAPVATASGTRTITLHTPDGGTMVGAGHVDRMKGSSQAPNWILVTFRLSLPMGELTYVPEP